MHSTLCPAYMDFVLSVPRSLLQQLFARSFIHSLAHSSSLSFTMSLLLNSLKGLPFLAACVLAGGASYPPKPADLSTPVQQRLAINGPNGEWNSIERCPLSNLS